MRSGQYAYCYVMLTLYCACVVKVTNTFVLSSWAEAWCKCDVMLFIRDCLHGSLPAITVLLWWRKSEDRRFAHLPIYMTFAFMHHPYLVCILFACHPYNSSFYIFIFLYIYMKNSPFNTLVWGSLRLAPMKNRN